jgi:nicotinamidase-related amidase
MSTASRLAAVSIRAAASRLLRRRRPITSAADLARVRELLAPARSALLIVDVQNDFTQPDGRVGPGRATAAYSAAIATINALVAAARASGVPVIYIRTEHNPATDPGPYRAVRARRPRSTEGICLVGSWGAEFAAELEPPRAGELVVTKTGYDGFATGELAPRLATGGRDSVVITGVATTLCVPATVAGAFEHGLYPIVPLEATAASNAGAARAALWRMNVHYGDIVSAAVVLEAWRS